MGGQITKLYLEAHINGVIKTYLNYKEACFIDAVFIVNAYSSHFINYYAPMGWMLGLLGHSEWIYKYVHEIKSARIWQKIQALIQAKIV